MASIITREEIIARETIVGGSSASAGRSRAHTCLIISPHFPPSTLAGVHRARHLARHLHAWGWLPKVICVDPKYHVEKLDYELAKLLPRDLEVIRTGAVPVEFSRLFGVAGDIGLRGLLNLRAAIAKEMARKNVDAVLITGSPYYPMLLAAWIKRKWNVPVVLDFQDPWVSWVGFEAPRWSKLGISHQLAIALEPRAVRNATFITSVSKQQNEEMAIRYPWLDRARMKHIPIGGDPGDFDALRTSYLDDRREKRCRRFSYVGTAMPRSEPLLLPLFRGLSHLRSRSPALASQIEFRFVGTSNQPNDSTTFRVRPLAEIAGVDDLVTEEPARVPYLDALKILATTDVVLLVGSDEPHYTASKIYPGLMSGRPFLSLFHRKSSSHEILKRAGGGVTFAFERPDDLDQLIPAIAEGLEHLAINPECFGKADPAAYADFTAHAVAGQFAQVFKLVTSHQHSVN